MGFHFTTVAVVTNVVAYTVLINVGVLLFLAGKLFGDREGLKNRAGVLFPTTEVIDFGHTWGLDEGSHEAGDIKRVDVVTDLFPLIAKDTVFLSLEVALHEIAKEAVQLDAGMIWTGKASSAQTTGRHAEIASVFLDHDVGSYLGSSEEGVLALINGEVFGDAVGVGLIGVIPSGLKLGEFDAVGSVAVDLVRGHVNEGGLGAGLTCCFEYVECADGIRVEVVKGDGGCTVMTRLGGGMHDCIGSDLRDELENSLAVADIQLVVDEALQLSHEALLVPPSVSLWAEEDGALVIIDSVNLVAEFIGEVVTNLGADKT